MVAHDHSSCSVLKCIFCQILISVWWQMHVLVVACCFLVIMIILTYLLEINMTKLYLLDTVLTF